MKIVDVRVQPFNFKSSVVNDSEGHTHPGPEHDVTQTLLTVLTDEGAEGYSFGASASVVEGVVKPALVRECIAKVAVRLGNFRIECDGPSVRGDCFIELTLFVKHRCEVAMRLR